MRVIDLLNKIANGEEPERFIKNNILWYKGQYDKEHYYGEGGKCQLNYIKLDELNDEIELIDETKILDNEDEDIEEIEYYDDSIAWVIDGAGQLSDIDKIAIDKINELVRKINKLKKEGK